MIGAETVEKKFRDLYHEAPLLVRSPGRVNLIGEHTDYNHGFVLPGAIDKAVTFAIAPSAGRTCRVFALDMNDEHQFAVNDLSPSPKRWPNYLMGVVDQLVRSRCNVGGFNCVFGSDIPIGAGLSSSAAIEAGLAFALNTIFDLGLEPLSLVKLSQRAENEFVGVKCGIMDQFINIFGQPKKVLRIDCRSLGYDYYPFDHDVAVVLFDTGVTHSLASSEYNRRREECTEGVNLLRQFSPRATHLRDITPELLSGHKSVLGPTIYKRCKYVVEENDRVMAGCSALKQGDLKEFGRLMYQTHEGLSCEYQVSCEELDHLVTIVKGAPGVLGARMMGGGFGGCTINLIAKEAVDDVSARVRREYARRFQNEPKTYITSISPGTAILRSPQHADD